jgi:hypothetical protein
VYWNLGQLSLLFLSDCSQVLDDMRLDSVVVSEVRADDTRWYFADDFLKGDILFEGWLEILDYAGFTDFKTSKIDHRQARIEWQGSSQLFKPKFVGDIFVSG